MPKWIIEWDCGFGKSEAIVGAETEENARMMAYEAAREDFESGADYSAQPYTQELAESLGLPATDQGPTWTRLEKG